MLNSLHIAKAPKDTRVVVAMSGGVDSSVVAGLLKKQGYEVIGITLQLYDHGQATAKKGACCAGADIQDAKRVAEKLAIPHYVLDYETRFKQAVIDKFAKSYLEGETPVPCIECNKTVKFTDLLQMAKDLGADVMATGHYIVSNPLENAHQGLYRPLDEERDQSYFLYGTTQAQLDFLRFPLGNLTKPQARELAHEMELVVADKPDSQDICFVPQGNYADIVSKIHPNALNKGNIIHLDGRVLGEHEGIIHYTIGQRKGLGIAVGEPLHVLKIDAKTNSILVGPREALLSNQILLRQINWLHDSEIENYDGLELYVKVRSTRQPKKATLNVLNGEVNITLFEGEEGVAPGQACVFYQSDLPHSRVLGGGIICKTDAKSLIIPLKKSA